MHSIDAISTLSGKMDVILVAMKSRGGGASLNFYKEPSFNDVEEGNCITGNLRNNSFSNTHNVGWLNHPNLSYINNKLIIPPKFQVMTQQHNSLDLDRFAKLEKTFIEFMDASKATQATIRVDSNNILTLQS